MDNRNNNTNFISSNSNYSKLQYLNKIHLKSKNSVFKKINIDDIYKSYKNKNVLVTGGAGFIGSNLVIKLCEIGANVLVVDSLIEDYGGNLFNLEPVKDKIKLNIADVRTYPTMLYLVKNQDYIFNLAGQVSHIDSMIDPWTDLEINCRSQLTILEACKKNNKDVKIVYAGTRQQYGKPNYLPVDEDHIVHPTDVNGINKMAGEWYHILYNNVYGIRACSLRLVNTYGPRQLLKHNRQGFIGWFIRLILEDKRIQLFGGGSQLRDFNYVDDVVDAFLVAGADESANGKFYNLGGKEPISLKNLVELMIEITGKGSFEEINFPEDRKKIDIGDFYSDYSKIKNELGWEPKVSIKEGLQKTFKYYEKYMSYYF
ncbi:MAG: GDP-mannose 4,6-dehydratase [Actinobacteria bacterium]|nr:GDP-mannose 4,6-dehydratase [Cyanobacteriota bacterium]MCL5771831.1 GDP-mannose 4,6-dehydratase [Actinomycetota bacterium]